MKNDNILNTGQYDEIIIQLLHTLKIEERTLEYHSIVMLRDKAKKAEFSKNIWKGLTIMMFLIWILLILMSVLFSMWGIK